MIEPDVREVRDRKIRGEKVNHVLFLLALGLYGQSKRRASQEVGHDRLNAERAEMATEYHGGERRVCVYIDSIYIYI